MALRPRRARGAPSAMFEDALMMSGLADAAAARGASPLAAFDGAGAADAPNSDGDAASCFRAHAYVSDEMLRAMEERAAMPDDDETVLKYGSDSVYPAWILNHEHFKEVYTKVREMKLQEALAEQPSLRTRGQLDILAAFLFQVWPLTAQLGPERVEQIARAATLRRALEGESVVVENDVGTTFYILVSGEVTVHKAAMPGATLATLKSGASFGEQALGKGAPLRNATVTSSVQQSVFLEIRKTDYDSILRTHQDCERRRALECLQRVKLFRGWAKARLERVCAMLQHRDVKAGVAIIRQGEAPDNVYFLERGSCAVVMALREKRSNRWPAGPRAWTTMDRFCEKRVTLVELGAGAYFGERGIVEGAPRAATVVATTDAHVVYLDRVAFLALIHRGEIKASQLSATVERTQTSEDELATLLATLGGRDTRPEKSEADLRAEAANYTSANYTSANYKPDKPDKPEKDDAPQRADDESHFDGPVAARRRRAQVHDAAVAVQAARDLDKRLLAHKQLRLAAPTALAQGRRRGLARLPQHDDARPDARRARPVWPDDRAATADVLAGHDRRAQMRPRGASTAGTVAARRRVLGQLRGAVPGDARPSPMRASHDAPPRARTRDGDDVAETPRSFFDSIHRDTVHRPWSASAVKKFAPRLPRDVSPRLLDPGY
ncbi:cyclic nucleotide-binding-like protein [Pelagophyceae sp. CCMP2097]|nr:cyclic nucleotide-binding-like protein [Pelagophyceae sp. CCMP2097]